MFDFVKQIWETRYDFSNNRYCTTGGTFDPIECPFTSEGLTKFNWGTMIIWIGYNFNDAELKWQMVNGTNLDFDYHYFGLKGSSAWDPGRVRNIFTPGNFSLKLNKLFRVKIQSQIPTPNLKT